MDPAADVCSADLLVVIDGFAVGGVASLYSTIVSTATAHGMSVAVVGRAGPAREQLDWGTARTIEVPGWDAVTAATVTALTDRTDKVVWQASPATLPLFLSHLAHPRMSLVVHGSAGLTRTWFGEERIAALVSALAARPTLGVMAPSPTMVEQLTCLLALAPGRCRVLPHVSAAPTSRHRPTPRPRPRVVVPTRVSPEKRFVISAAHDLASARRVPLTVVGAGDDTDWVRSLGQVSDVEVELVLDADIHRHVATDDVVVAVGLVALESARYCAAVVSASLDRGGCLDRVLTPDTVDDLHAANFLGTEPGLRPDEVWRAIAGLTDEDRVQVRRRLDVLADPRRSCSDLVRACEADAGAFDLTHLPTALAATSRAWISQSGSDAHWIDALVEGHDWLTLHSAELERAADHHRERADALEQRLVVVESEP